MRFTFNSWPGPHRFRWKHTIRSQKFMVLLTVEFAYGDGLHCLCMGVGSWEILDNGKLFVVSYATNNYLETAKQINLVMKNGFGVCGSFEVRIFMGDWRKVTWIWKSKWFSNQWWQRKRLHKNIWGYVRLKSFWKLTEPTITLNDIHPHPKYASAIIVTALKTC